MQRYMWVLAVGIVIFFQACTNRTMEVTPEPVANDCTGNTPSFSKDIEPIVARSCAKAGCHDGSSMPHDFSKYSELKPVLDDSELYYYVIKDKLMPLDSALDAAKYQLIKCWVASGYPDN